MRFLLFAISAVFFFPLAAHAQGTDVVDTTVIDDKAAGLEGEEKEGWKKTAKVSANLSYNRVDNVVGAVEGATWQLGAQLNASANYVSGNSRWENSLSFNFTQTRTPTLPVFVKSADELKLDTLYLYQLGGWWGPYAQGTFTTAVARGFDVRAEDVQIQRTFNDDPTNPVILDKSALERFRLTDPFEPITLSGVIGLFATAIESKMINARLKAGLGGEQVIVGTGFVLADDAATEVIEYTQLQDSTQVGAVLDAKLSGTLAENITYTATGRMFYAGFSNYEIINQDGTTRDLEGSELLSTELEAKLSAKLASWASLDYVLIFKRIPWVVDVNQVTNGVIVSVTYDLI